MNVTNITGTRILDVFSYAKRDNKANPMVFIIKRYTDDELDLRLFTWKITVKNAKNEKYICDVDNVEVTDSHILVSWMPNRDATKYAGTTMYNIIASMTNEEGVRSVIQFVDGKLKIIDTIYNADDVAEIIAQEAEENESNDPEVDPEE